MTLLKDSLTEVGAARSIVTDETDTILAGNATAAAAQAIGITHGRVIEAEGDELIIVKRRNLTPLLKERLKQYDNQTAALADWEPEIVKALLEEDERIFAGILDSDELDEILQRLPDVDFKEYDESVEDEVQWCECPNCGHRFPK